MNQKCFPMKLSKFPPLSFCYPKSTTLCTLERRQRRGTILKIRAGLNWNNFWDHHVFWLKTDWKSVFVETLFRFLFFPPLFSCRASARRFLRPALISISVPSFPRRSWRLCEQNTKKPSRNISSIVLTAAFAFPRMSDDNWRDRSNVFPISSGDFFPLILLATVLRPTSRREALTLDIEGSGHQPTDGRK